MNLPFSTHWPGRMPEHLAGKPTYFPEKIWASIPEEILIEWLKKEHTCKYDATGVWLLFFGETGYQFSWDKYLQFREEGAKIHTIRRDSKNRWKKGMLIDFWINMRTKKQFRFAPRIPAVDVWGFTITSDEEICESNCIEPTFIVDEDHLSLFEMEGLIQNDGFEKTEDFYSWFNEDFSGILINWTDFKY